MRRTLLLGETGLTRGVAALALPARRCRRSHVPAHGCTQSRTILVHDLTPDGPVREAGPLPPFLLDESDKPELVRHLLLLPEEQRYTRFIGTMTDDAIEGFVARIDLAADLLAGSRGPDGGLAGVAQSSPHAKDGWELAFSTAPAFQRQGVATMLGRWLLEHLASRGGREAYIYCAPKNIAMRGLARKLAFDLHIEGGEVVANRRLAAPTSPP